MKPVKAKKDFNIDGVYYFEGDTIDTKFTMDTLNKLNEKGYIEPLSLKDMIQYEKELNKEVK